MSFFQALYTSTSGMMAQSQSTAMISNNIANLNSVGYKRSEASFSDMVTTGQASSSYSYAPGAVKTTQIQRISQSGTLQQTTSSTDTAISGQGFFTVYNTPFAAETSAEPLYTRNGSFGLTAVYDEAGNETAYLSNSVGQYLYGWALENGTAQEGTLVPIQIDMTASSFSPTTQISQSISLDAEEAMIDMLRVTGGPLPLPASSQSYYGVTDTSQAAHFSRDISVVDALGDSHNLTFEYRRVVGPMAHFSSSLQRMERDDEFVDASGQGITAAINAGDQITITTTGTAAAATPGGTPTTTTFSETYTFVDPGSEDVDNNQIATVGDLLDALRAHGDGNQLEARLSDSGQLLIQAVDLTATISVSEDVGSPLSGASTLNIITAPDGTYTYAPELDIATGLDSADNVIYANQTDFPTLANTTDPNTQGWWEVRILTAADPGITDPTDPLYQQPIEISKGLINFDSNGLLNTATNALGQVTGATIDLGTIDFDSSSAGEEITVSADISRYVHYAGSHNVVSYDQDGIEPGYPVDAKILRDGTVSVELSNGSTQELYQIPLAVFANSDGLDSVSGTAFRASLDSGAVTYTAAGANGAGIFQSSFVENANVDLADEFGDLIVSQRAFSANSKVVTTVDEMTRFLAQLKR